LACWESPWGESVGGSVGRGGEDERAESACAGRYHAVQRAIGLAPRFPAVADMAFKATGGRLIGEEIQRRS